MNQTLEAFLWKFINKGHDYWKSWLLIAELAVNGQEAKSTKISLFFLQHRFNLELFDLFEKSSAHASEESRSPARYMDAIVKKLKQAMDLAQAALAVAQQE